MCLNHGWRVCYLQADAVLTDRSRWRAGRIGCRGPPSPPPQPRAPSPAPAICVVNSRIHVQIRPGTSHNIHRLPISSLEETLSCMTGNTSLPSFHRRDQGSEGAEACRRSPAEGSTTQSLPPASSMGVWREFPFPNSPGQPVPLASNMPL